MAVFRKFFDQELWEFKCSKADCNCNNQPMPAEYGLYYKVLFFPAFLTNRPVF